MSTEAVTELDPDLRLRLSLCAIDFAERHAEAAGRPAVMHLTESGRMVLRLPSGRCHEVLGDEMDEFQARGWVEVDDAGEGSLRLTEAGRYWAARARRDRSFLRAVGVL